MDVNAGSLILWRDLGVPAPSRMDFPKMNPFKAAAASMEKCRAAIVDLLASGVLPALPVGMVYSPRLTGVKVVALQA